MTRVIALRHSSNNFGDAIGDSRIIPYVAPHCPGVTLALGRELLRLFSRLGFPVVALDDVDPALCGSHPASFLPPRVRLPHFEHMELPPLWADESVKLNAADKLQVGLCWHGSGGGRSARLCVRGDTVKRIWEERHEQTA